MQKVFQKVGFFLLLSFLVTVMDRGIFFPSIEARGKSSLTVAYAANLEYVIRELKVVFEKKYPWIDLVVLNGSSGRHNAQIRNGAPIDVFLSADLGYPQKLTKDGLGLGKPKIYAYGTLVLWTLFTEKENHLKEDNKRTSEKEIPLDNEIKVLLSPLVQRIAIANPQLAPYGAAAVQVLKAKKIFPLVEQKLVYAENAGAATQYVYTRSTEVGFVPKSAVLSPTLHDKGKWLEMDSSLYKPIAQAMVILPYAKAAGHLENAKLFFHFIGSAEAREVFTRYGYRLPKY